MKKTTKNNLPWSTSAKDYAEHFASQSKAEITDGEIETIIKKDYSPNYGSTIENRDIKEGIRIGMKRYRAELRKRNNTPDTTAGQEVLKAMGLFRHK